MSYDYTLLRTTTTLLAYHTMGHLEATLANTQTPHQPLLVISDSLAASGHPVWNDQLARAIDQ